ncbi:hypothetical protein AGMMS49975_14450 [Clostridia bacterium]|nr:hypothetical protein AGMMS49975_14450 [Clostridia bacterium]
MDIKVTDISNVQPVELPVKERASSDEFMFTLSRVGEDGLNERLNNLIGEITASGKRLAEHMDIGDLRKYKSLVRDFINEVTTNSYKFSRENFLDRRGRHRVYGIVKRVDKELENLSKEVLSAEKDHLRILEKADEIRGLLLDILI